MNTYVFNCVVNRNLIFNSLLGYVQAIVLLWET